MSDTTKAPRIERTPEQKAEEKRLRELHQQASIREVPSDTLRGRDVAQLLKFVAAVRRERESQGLTIEQLAERAGIDAGVLKRFEGGQAFNPTIATVHRIASALGRNLRLAFDGTTQQQNQ